jgi:hypothetical protein
MPNGVASRPEVEASHPSSRPRPGWRSRLKRLAFTARRAIRSRTTRSPGSTATRKRRRWRIAFAAIAALLAYPVLGTLALVTGFVEWVAHSEDLRVEITNPAYTVWPGRIHMKHVRVLANGDTQFILEGADMRAHIRVLELFKRRIHVSELAARDVRYQMRTQVDDDKGIEERLAAYPPLKDLPGAKVIREKAAQQTEPREAPWTVEVDGLDISVIELWFFEYRYLGDGRLRGGFLVGPKVMEVTTAVQDLGPGELRFGAERPIANQLQGQITADIPRVNPEEHADASFFELVDARVQLRANVLSLAHVSAYLDGLEVSRGAGPFSTDLHLAKGVLGTRSHLKFHTDSVRLKGHGFGVETDARLEFDAAGEREAQAPKQSGLPLLRSSSNATYVSLARERREFTLQIHDHREEVALDTIKLSGSTTLKRASIRMPSVTSVDLDDLGAVLPEDAPLAVQGGEARASLSLDMDKDYWARGPVKASIEGAKLDVAGIELAGNTSFQARAKFNPKLENYTLEAVTLALRDVGMRAGDERVDGWWLDVQSPRVSLRAGEPLSADGSVSVRAKSLEPVLEALASKDQLSEVIPVLTRLDDFRARLTFRSKGPQQDVVLESESDVWDVSGRVFKSGEQTLLAMVIGGQAVSVGVASLGDGLEIQPFAKTSWLNSRLRAFPKPLVQLPPSKP